MSTAVVVAMSAGLLSLAPSGFAVPAAPAVPAADAADTPGAPLSERDAKATAKALKEAKETGKPVEIPSRRTETDEVFINPDGTARVDRSILPVRVRQGSKLVDIDPNLAAGADGRLAPKASAMAVSFSGGGDDVFATMIREGRTVTLTWPHGKLPKPTVDGRTATYANVLPGVDLTATADDVSFSHALVVKTPAAAKNPAVRSVDFGLRTRGLQVTQGEAGELLAKNPSRDALFAAPQPHMWDSAGSETSTAIDPKTPKAAKPTAARSLQETLEGAVEGSNRAKLGVKLGAGKITLTPDAKLLDDPETVFPVVIDPKWAPDAWKNAWSIAYKHSYYANTENTVYYNGGTLSDHARVGVSIDGDNGGTVRANTYFRIPIGSLAGKDIIKSTLRIKQTHAGSWSCNSGDVQVKTIGNNLPTNITWNNQPAWGALVDSSGESYGGRNCPSDSAGLVEFDVTSGINDAVDDKWGSWSFVLTSKSNAVDTSWRKFDPNSARVSTYYNTLPTRPTLSIDPSLPCAGGIIGTTDEIVLSASKFRDAEDADLDVEFKWAQNGQPAKTVSRNASSGGTAQLRIPAGTTLPSATFWYEAIVKDSVGNSPRAGRCYFTYDRTGPKNAPKVSSLQWPENVGKGCTPDLPAGTPCAKPARTTGSFTFAANPAPGETNDITEYIWWTDYDTKEKSAKPTATGGSVTVPVRPMSNGPQYLYVRSEDAANNRSRVKAYLFIPSRSDKRDKLGDLNGDDLVDLVALDPGAGTLWSYPSRGDGTFGTGMSAKDESFASGTVSVGGSWDDDDYYEDLVSLQPAADDPSTYELWAYRGNGGGKLLTGDRDRQNLTIAVNNCYDPARIDCDNHWAKGAEIVSVPSLSDDDGAPYGGPDGVIDERDFPDLLVKEGANLWLYLGSRTGGLLDNFSGPIALGNADWQDMTIMTPGDLNKDGLPEIWARDKVKGTIHQYTSKRATTPGQGNVLADLTVYGDPAVRQTSIATGFKAVDVPNLSTTGDFENDGFADLWSRDGLGRAHVYSGQAPVNGQSFKAARYITTTGYDWNECKSFAPATGTTAISICGPILGKYEALGGAAVFGKPTSGVTTVSDGGRYVNFAQPGTTATDRAISWSKTTGAWSVANGVFSRWVTAGRETGTLGYPTADERQTGVQGGTFITFSKAGKAGAIYWRDGIGSQMITGAIYNQYVKLGGVRVYGYPTGDAVATTGITGLVQHFRSGTSTTDNHSFYYNSTTGAWPVTGSIRTHWLSKGGHTGALGFPTSAEYTVYGGRRTTFKNGYIRWNRQTGHVAEHAWTDRTAHLRTDLAGDYDGDGRTDIFTVYDYEKGGIGLYVSRANANDGHNPPQEYYATDDPGDWYYDSSKWASGDFNGDGRDDLVGFYGYGTGAVKAYTFLSQASGGPVGRTSIDLPTGQWDWSKSTMLAGDLNGDGRDDLAFTYDHGNGVLGVYRALSRADGTFENPVLSFKTPATWWYMNSASYTMGDTNGDGRDDIVALYGYAAGEARLFTFAAKADGHLSNYVGSWSAPAGVWERSRGKMTTADFNKDGRDDLAFMYGYDDGRTEARIFHARTDGGFDGFVTPYASLPGNWYSTSTGNLVAGDMNADGYPDITTSYNYAIGETRVFTFHGNAAGTVDRPARGWYARPGTW
ncbi:FG-GAP-like repeat-containing protein [Streptomyces sp. NPDC014773]|uniref:FG-GAP-like repeat-containing protein n=1 Tax=Streptomyces sp. NPDC014773 TaxID=3364908 RepID=UPI003700B39E